MKIWQNFKNFHFNKSLNKGLVSRSKQVSSKTLSFATAKSIAFLFNAEDPEVISGIEKYAESLQKKGKKSAPPNRQDWKEFKLGVTLKSLALRKAGLLRY